ncbi:MAG TPA: arginine--tRNA ligase, partial [Thermomicrobiales bacterium]|nr:arginine--tRNA ligase [Thermomicrobiales bacterium]
DPAAYVAMIRPVQDRRFGDFQANCAMPLAKERGQKPRDVAAEIVAGLDVADLCDPPDIAGPGFINLRLKDEWLHGAVNATAEDERLGVPPAPRPRRIVVDFSGPNVAKPMHVGHLRSTVIGDALARVLGFLGHHVLRENHIGDWGTQFGMIIYGYKHFRDDAAYQREPVAELARLYRLVNQLADYRDALAEIPGVRQRLDERQAALDTARATADAKDKDAQKALKKQQTDVQELREELAGLEKKVQAVESDAALKALADAHPDIGEKARLETAKLHAGDAENRRLWDQFLPECLAALDAMYRRLGITFDMQLGESHFQPMLADVVRDLQARGLARESDGAICVFLEGHEAPFIIRKRDGAFTYATTDLATIRYRA